MGTKDGMIENIERTFEWQTNYDVAATKLNVSSDQNPSFQLRNMDNEYKCPKCNYYMAYDLLKIVAHYHGEHILSSLDGVKCGYNSQNDLQEVMMHMTLIHPLEKEGMVLILTKDTKLQFPKSQCTICQGMIFLHDLSKHVELQHADETKNGKKRFTDSPSIITKIPRSDAEHANINIDVCSSDIFNVSSRQNVAPPFHNFV